MRRVVAVFVVSVALCVSSGCAYHRTYTQWGESEETSRRPLGDARRDDNGQCVRDFRVNYQQEGTINEQTVNLRSSIIGVAALAAGSLGSMTLGIAGDDAGLFVFGLVAGITSVVWGTYTLIMAVTADDPEPTSRERTEEVTLADESCGSAAQIAQADCRASALVDRKLAQLEELRVDALIAEDEYARERSSLEASRCPESGVSDARERLDKLSALRADGLITEEEYARKRQSILDSL